MAGSAKPGRESSFAPGGTGIGCAIVIAGLAAALGFSGAVSVQAAEPLPLIPWPAEVEATGDDFELQRDTVIEMPSAALRDVAVRLQSALEGEAGFKLRIVEQRSVHARFSSPSIQLIPGSPQLAKEGYRLEVSRHGVRLEAHGPAGFFHGAQSLLQLQNFQRIAGAVIADIPRFKWRGLMLDVSRHFFDKEFIKSYLDEMARYKFNVFHWHLTDDQGWRIEIKSLPRLTDVGAWRAPRASLVDFNDRTYPSPDLAAGPREGGYYSQDDIREIVAYAKERHITVVPEIDVPGHSYAMIAAYPQLSCSGKLASEPLAAESAALCPGNEAVFVALEKIFAEVAALFPGEYVHVGADEVRKEGWRDCVSCERVMQRERLKDLDALQGYFLRRVERIVRSHRKRLIGWDEILGSGVSTQAVVMAWQGGQRGIAAAAQGHAVIMTPFEHAYLDFPQGDPALEPVGASWGKGAPLLLSACHAFDPAPPGIDPARVLGGQGNLWTEFVSNGRHAQYMTWPRALALSEALWSPRERRPWPDFIQRMEAQFRRFEARGVKFARSVYEPRAELRKVDGEHRIVLFTQVPQIDLYYTFDGSNPDPFYPKYTGPLSIPPGAKQLRVVAYRNGERAGAQLNVGIADLVTRWELHEKHVADSSLRDRPD